VALSSLIAFLCYQYSINLFKQLFTAGALLSSLVFLFFMLAVQFNNQRTTINIKAISTLATIVNLFVLFLFSGAGSTQVAFVISHCFLMVIYLGLVYAISQKSTS
jgi:hypothetical protein